MLKILRFLLRQDKYFFEYNVLWVWKPTISQGSIVNINLPPSPLERYNVMSAVSNQAKSLPHAHVACMKLALSIHEDGDLLYISPQLVDIPKSIQLF